MSLLIDVATSAAMLGVSTRRVRALLSEGRMRGVKGSSGVWLVAFPFSISPGRRGPDLRRFPTRLRCATGKACQKRKPE